MVHSHLNMYLFELVVSRSMEFRVTEKADCYDYQPVTLYMRGWIQGPLKSLKRPFLSPTGFAFRQGLASSAAHHNYHLIKQK